MEGVIPIFLCGDEKLPSFGCLLSAGWLSCRALRTLSPGGPHTLPSLQSDSIMTITGETLVLCLLGKNKFDCFMVVDRILS